MKINVIMPTYNDSLTITESLDSLKMQNYDNWHLTIVNDGSKDNTEKIVKNYIKKNNLEDKITYVYQENSDQLNAIKTALKNIKDKDGLVYVLHSDDLMNDKEVFQKANDYFSQNDVDAIISNYQIINKDSKIIGYQKVKQYQNKYSTIALQGLWLGRNLFVDVAFWKMEVYSKNVLENYLNWNTPFWLNYNDKLSMLNVQNVDFPFFKYRVFDDNYINNEIGLLNVLNGELRTELNILKHIHIPFYKIQYFLFRLLNKLHIPYKVFYLKKESKNIYNKIKFIINKRISNDVLDKYPYYKAILNFFKNIDNNRVIELRNINKEDVFLGSDVRLFNNKMINNKLPKIYNSIFKYMEGGFSKVITDKNSYENVVNILKFIDIYNFVDIEVK